LKAARTGLLLLAFVVSASCALAQDGTLAGQLQTQSAATDLQGTTPPVQPSASTNAPPAAARAPTPTPQPVPAEKPPAPAKPAEAETAYAPLPGAAPVPQALHHMSEHRFFYAAGFFAFNILVLLSVSNTAARRIFGTFSVLGFLFLLHYVFIGLSLPKLRPNDWTSAYNRGIGLRSVKEWKRIPDIGTSLYLIREKNFLGPKNKVPLTNFFEQVISQWTAGKSAKIDHGKGFISNRIRWRTAEATLGDGRTLYFWCAELKQQRIVVMLSNAPGADETDVREIAQVVGKIR
jgi:hypothetical protein